MGPLSRLIVKEVKDLLRDPRILIGMIVLPAAMYPVMGLAMGTAMSAGAREALERPIAVLDLDRSPESEAFTRSLGESANLVELEPGVDPEAEAAEIGAGGLIVVPEGFGASLRSGSRAQLRVACFLRGSSISETMFASRLEEVVRSAAEGVSREMISSAGLDPDVALNPIDPSYTTFLKGRRFDLSPGVVAGLLAGTSSTLPMVAFVVIIMGMQLAATSVAVEKEEKTLETLLSLPISRRDVLLAKLVGSLIVAAAGSVGIMAGMLYYMQVFQALGESPPPIEMGPASPLSALAMGLSLLVGNLMVLTLATVVAVFSEDVRSAQSAVGVLIPLILIPMLMSMFTDPWTLPEPVRTVILAFPFTHIGLATSASFWWEPGPLALSLGYMALWTVALVVLAERLFWSEKVLTGRLPWARPRGGGG